MTGNIIIDISINITMLLIGVVIGNRLAIGRDKRKEFNVIAEKIRLALVREKEFIVNDNMAFGGVEDVDFVKLGFRLHCHRLRRFNNLIAKYKENKENNIYHDGFGKSSYHNNNTVLDSIDKLLRVTRLK